MPNPLLPRNRLGWIVTIASVGLFVFVFYVRIAFGKGSRELLWSWLAVMSLVVAAGAALSWYLRGPSISMQRIARREAFPLEEDKRRTPQGKDI